MNYLKNLSPAQRSVYQHLVSELWKAGDMDASTSAYGIVMQMTDEEAEKMAKDITDGQKLKYKVYATKLDRDEGAVFENICEKQHITPYGKIQELVSAYIRLCDPGSVLNENMRKMMLIFDIAVDKDKCFELADPSVQPVVMEATYWLGEAKKGGRRLVHVWRPTVGQAERSENTQEILEMTLEALFPTLYAKIRQAGAEMGCTNLLDILSRFADEYIDVRDKNEMRQMFDDNRKDDCGREMADGPYRRTMVNSMETAEQRWERRQQTIDFGE